LKGSLHLGLAVLSDVSVTGSLDGSVRFCVVLAGTVLGSVFVGALKVSVVRLVPFESLVLVTTVATMIGSIAVNELLFREAVEIAVLDGPLGFEGTVG